MCFVIKNNFKKDLSLLFKNSLAQATVEAGLMIPVLLILLIILIQPGIIFYDKTIMNSAASETCRVLSTCSEDSKKSICENFAKRRLRSIPQQDLFHVHNDSCSYKIELEGNEQSNSVSVSISNKIRLLPLIDFLFRALGASEQNGLYEIKSDYSMITKPDWVKNNTHKNTEEWVGQWLK